MNDPTAYESEESYEAAAAIRRMREVIREEDAKVQFMVWVALIVLVVMICAATWVMAQHDAAEWAEPTTQALPQ